MKKQAIVLALSLAVIAPSLAFADLTTTSVTVTSSVSAQIAMLQAQIKSLMAQIEALKGGSPLPSRWCHAFGANLGVGSKGDEVAALENALSQEGSVGLEHSSNFAASFDERMASAVTGFQEKYRDEILTPNGLKYGTGFVGKSTRAKLNALYGCYPYPVPPKPTTGIPVISSVSGPTVLSVNQTGTWTVLAYDKEQQTLTYSVNWGDENYPVPMMQSASGAALGSQSTTFTHSYSIAGKYKVSFTVKDSDGNAAYSSITVQVGSVIGYNQITVLSPNGGETWTKGQTQTIKWQDNSPVPLWECPVGANCVPPAPSSYDIKLAPYYAPCTTSPCPMTAMMYPYLAPYTIASGVYGSSYNWFVAHTIDIDAIGNAPDGSYTVQVCKAGTEVCDSSDSYFKIISGTTGSAMQVLSPNGGESWPIGGNKTITWKQNGTSRVDISLVPHPVYCITTPCPQPAPYSIDRSVLGDSYQWLVGFVINSANNGFEYAPSGSYQVKVCTVDGSVCDTSDSYFTIDRYTTY